MKEITHESTGAERMESVLSVAFRGIHHVPKITKYGDGNQFWAVNVRSGIATFDSDQLTRLVLAAHHFAVRVEIQSSGPGLVKLLLHTRKRDGNIYESHPTIQQAIEKLSL